MYMYAFNRIAHGLGKKKNIKLRISALLNTRLQRGMEKAE